MNLLILCLAPALLLAAPPTDAEARLLQSVSAATLKSHVSFLASDLLEGRDTPSRGLDLAAEYIAAQFLRLGLKPGGGDGYFQSAPYTVVRQPMDAFQLTIDSGGKTYTADKARAMVSTAAALKLDRAPLLKLDWTEGDAPLPARALVEGKAVLLVDAGGRSRAAIERRAALAQLGPAVILTQGFVFQQRQRLRAASDDAAAAPAVTVNDALLASFARDLAPGATISLNFEAPAEEPVHLRNVIGVLEGSDPQLKNSFLLLTAHYDHTGVNPRGDSDRINNGANDDASGVATVLAIAEAFVRSGLKPRRSIVFMTYFGEEKGLLGSRYYAAHPAFPLAQTVANLNFEHMGRTDDTEGPRAGKITASGFDFTSLGQTLTDAGAETGVEAWKDEKNSDLYFPRSDNQALADAGVPAITVAVTWMFPDYHRPGDHADKIDYANMERTVRTCALAAARVAAAAQPVAWIESNPKTARYVKAHRALSAAQ